MNGSNEAMCRIIVSIDFPVDCLTKACKSCTGLSFRGSTTTRTIEYIKAPL